MTTMTMECANKIAQARIEKLEAALRESNTALALVMRDESALHETRNFAAATRGENLALLQAGEE